MNFTNIILGAICGSIFGSCFGIFITELFLQKSIKNIEKWELKITITGMSIGIAGMIIIVLYNLN